MNCKIKQAIGVVADELAYQKITKMGFKVLLRHYECPVGEVDLIAKKDGKLVFFVVNRKMDEDVKKTAAYYLKRYGIKDVSCEFKTINTEDPAIENKTVNKKERTDSSIDGATRNDLMEAVKRLGIKNFRVMNKEELKAIVNGATGPQIEAIQLAAVTRWKSGWGKKKKAVSNGA